MDFYSGIIYQAMGFPVSMFPVLFAIGRVPGWLAQWQESTSDPDQKIARARSTQAKDCATSTERSAEPARPALPGYVEEVPEPWCQVQPDCVRRPRGEHGACYASQAARAA